MASLELQSSHVFLDGIAHSAFPEYDSKYVRYQKVFDYCCGLDGWMDGRMARVKGIFGDGVAKLE